MANEEGDEELRTYIRKLVREESSSGSGESRGGGVELGEFGKFVAAAKGMKEAMTSDVDKALSTAVSNKIVDQVIPSMSPQQRAPSGFLDSNFAIAIGQKIPEQLPTLVDIILTRLGPDRSGKLVDGITHKLMGDGSGGTEADKLLSLDQDNPAHLHQYMAMKNLNDPDIAKRALIAEKSKAMSTLYAGGTTGGAGNGGVGTSVGGEGGGNTGLIQALESQNAVLKDLIQAKTEDRKVMEALFYEINKLKKEKADSNESGNISEDLNIDSSKNSEQIDKLSRPINEKGLKLEKPEASPEKENIVNDEIVKLDDVVVKTKEEKSEKSIDEKEIGINNEPVVNENSIDKREEDKKTTIVMKRSGSVPKFE